MIDILNKLLDIDYNSTMCFVNTCRDLYNFKRYLNLKRGKRLDQLTDLEICRLGRLELAHVGMKCKIDDAAKYSLNLVIWLHENGNECTFAAMDFAARRGHLNVGNEYGC